MSHERVSGEAAQEHLHNFHKVQERFNASSPHEVISDADIYAEWKRIIPQGNYGMISLTKVVDNFDKKYQSALKNHTATNLTENTFSSPEEASIYIVNTTTPDNLTPSEREIFDNHQPLTLAGGEESIASRLEGFRHLLSQHVIPDAYQDEYDRVITEQERFIEQALGLGTPEFTIKQKTPEGWAKFIDRERTIQTGIIHLPLEDIARDIIVRASEQRNDAHRTVHEAFAQLNITEEEKKTFGLDAIPEDAVKLTNEQTTSLFSLMLNRCDLSSWKIAPDSGSAINVSAGSKTIKIPKSRELTASQIPYIPPHELVHVISGENGLKQGFQKLATGVADYESTQEGIAVMAEMMMGEPFGHERQVAFAARYLIVAMMLKAKEQNGEIVPLYSPQDIFDELTHMGVSDEDAASNIWRAVRGTSLSHKGLTLDVSDDNGTKQISAAECNIKDTIYLQGQIDVFNYIKEHLPLLEGQNAKDTLDAEDFNVQFLNRVGIARYKDEQGNRPIPYSELKSIHSHLRHLGKDTLLDILAILTAPGKIRLDFLSEESPWNNQLKFRKEDGIVMYDTILRPKMK